MMKKLKKFAKKKFSKTADKVQGSSPRITTKTIAEHREEVLGGARKYIYPLQHSKHSILLISVSVLVVGIISFFGYTTYSLYASKSNSTFLYRVTQVLPFPVAQAGSSYVAYENYLFELRHYIHYYESQQKLDFDTVAGRDQLNDFKKQALEKVINDAYVNKLAEKYGLTVSGEEVDAQIAVVRDQNRLGGSEQVFEDVLKDFWGWGIDDFKRSLSTQLLAQKVVVTLDTETKERANNALRDITKGKDFADVASQYSDDTSTKDNGGVFGVVDQTNRDLTAKTTETLFSLKEGDVSGIINIGYSLEIIKNLETISDTRIKGAHILFNFKDVSTYITDIKSQETPRSFITF
jgi:hypothetical protein